MIKAQIKAFIANLHGVEYYGWSSDDVLEVLVSNPIGKLTFLEIYVKDITNCIIEPFVFDILLDITDPEFFNSLKTVIGKSSK